MQAEIISIGDELLIGQTVNTNATWLGSQLNAAGIWVCRSTSIADKKEEIVHMLDEAMSRSGLIIITGGLGPTKDDITKTTLCEYFESKLVINEEALERIRGFFQSRGLPMLEINEKQAEMPHNCMVIQNFRGTACGMWFEKNGAIVVSMPGVPYEMQGMMEEFVIPELSRRLGKGNIVHRTVLTTGIGESFLAEKISVWEESLAMHDLKLAYLPSPGQVKLRLSSYQLDKNIQEERIERKLKELNELIGEYIFGSNDDTLQSVVGVLLRKEGKSLAVAESCTGGFLSHLITSVPGSSDYFAGGAITYATRMKEEMLGVSKSLIDQYGVVSIEVAEAMAQGTLHNYKVDFAVAITGVAGPSGGSELLPVGSVCVAVASRNGLISEKFRFGRRRQHTIEMAANAGLNMLRKEILRKKGA